MLLAGRVTVDVVRLWANHLHFRTLKHYSLIGPNTLIPKVVHTLYARSKSSTGIQVVVAKQHECQPLPRHISPDYAKQDHQTLEKDGAYVCSAYVVSDCWRKLAVLLQPKQII